VVGPGTRLSELNASPSRGSVRKFTASGLLYLNSFSLKMGKTVLPSQFWGENAQLLAHICAQSSSAFVISISDPHREEIP
jgi:hypothetical protein